TTVFSCSGVDNNGCSNISAITVSVSECAGLSVKQAGQQSSFEVFPNPTKERITLTKKGNAPSEMKAEVFDAAGKLMLSQQLRFNASAHSTELNLSGLAAGHYLVKLTGGGKPAETLRIVKE